jgi:hypothetical protein
MDNTVPTTELDLQARSGVIPIDSPAAAAVTPLSHSAQGYAKGLMDELFGDLDGLLDGTLVPPSEPLKVEEPKPRAPINLDFATFLSTHPSQLSSQLSSQFSAVGLSAAGLSAAGLSAAAGPDLLSIPQDKPMDVPPSIAEVAQNEARQSSYGLFEKMLIFVGCSSAVAAVMIMLGSQGVLSRVFAALKAGSDGSMASAPANPNDVKFADYMGKALDSIDAKVKSNQPAANVPGLTSGIPGTSTLPTVKVPGSKPGSNLSGPSIVVGGALRPTSLGTAPGNVTGNIPSNVPGVAPTNAVQNELNQAVSKLSSLVDRMANGSRSSVAIAPVSVVPGITMAARAPQPAAVSQAPAPARTLKAVMELGAQSAVLFEMNGVSQRYEKGENIGTSGWVVVKIENGSAIVRRNGEVRTLSVGQKI